MNARKRQLWMVAGIILVLILSACGSSTSGGSGSSSSGSGTPNVTVNLTGVINAQRITVTLYGVSDGGTGSANLTAQMGVLIGDSNGNGAVSSADVAQTKSRSGVTVDATNFRSDVNANAVSDRKLLIAD